MQARGLRGVGGLGMLFFFLSAQPPSPFNGMPGPAQQNQQWFARAAALLIVFRRCGFRDRLLRLPTTLVEDETGRRCNQLVYDWSGVTLASC